MQRKKPRDWLSGLGDCSLRPGRIWTEIRCRSYGLIVDFLVQTNLPNPTGPGDLCPRNGDQNIGSRWAGRSTNEICSRCGVQNQKATPTYSQGVDRYTKHTQLLICSFFPPRGSDWGQFVSLLHLHLYLTGIINNEKQRRWAHDQRRRQSGHLWRLNLLFLSMREAIFISKTCPEINSSSGAARALICRNLCVWLSLSGKGPNTGHTQFCSRNPRLQNHQVLHFYKKHKKSSF